MPVSIIDIDVNDTKFKEFQANFDKYREAVGKLPDDWAKVNEEHKLSVGFAGDLAAALMAQAELLHKSLLSQIEAGKHVDNTAESQEKLNRATQSTHHSMTNLARSTKSVASHMKDAVESLIKWSTVTTMFSSAAGGFGLARLAGSASSMRRVAQGLGYGATTGGMQAYEVNFGKYVDPDSNLERISDARNDLNKRWAFGAMGVNDYDRKSPDQLGAEMLVRAKQIFDSGDQSQQSAEANGLLTFYSMDDLRRLHTMSMKELQESEGGFQSDRNSFSLDDKTLKDWQNFNIQLHRAGDTIENSFIRGLSGLTTPLGRFSVGIANAVDALFSNPHMKDWMNDIGVGLEHLADYLKKEDLKQDVDDFLSALERMGKALHHWAFMLGWAKTDSAPDSTSGSTATTQGDTGGGGSQTGGADGNAATPLAEAQQNIAKAKKWGRRWGIWGPDPDEPPPAVSTESLRSGMRGLGFHQSGIDASGRTVGQPGYDPFSDPTGANPQGYFQQLEDERHLPAGTLDATWFMESKRGKRLETSSAGAMGQFQFMPGTAQQYHVTNPYSVSNSARGAADYLSDLFQKYNDINKANAAFNWGPGNLDADIKKNGADWLKNAPPETQTYVKSTEEMRNARANTRVLPGTGVIITVNNNAGADIHTSASQVAVQ